jgi:hypothetical protein
VVEVVPSPVGQVPVALDREQALDASALGADHVPELLHPPPDSQHVSFGRVGG